jgi:hypothetical protein
MATPTYGTRDGTRFAINGVQYYTLVDSSGPTRGQITIKSPTVLGNLPGAGAGQDRTVGVIPLDNAFRPTPGSATTAETTYFSSAAGQKATKNQAVVTAQKAGATDAQQLIFPNTAASPASPASPAAPNNGGAQNNGASGSTEAGTGAQGYVFDPNTQSVGSRINKYETGKNPLIYPLKRQGYGGDYISFEIRTYQKSGLASPTAQGRTGTKDVTLVGMEKRQATTLAYIYLPIQSGISDSMSVDWGTGELSPITAAFANMAYSVINRAGQGDIGGYAKGAAKDFGNVLKGFGNASPELRAMMVNYFVEQSVGVNGLLSRTIGGAINNNLELLFNGPTLRSFTFNFKLTAREPEEAVLIKNIIRYFKKSMVPGLSQSKLFLLAPNVFKIKYVYTGKGDDVKGHPYLNKIKVAALRDMSVNYTPDGNYMTYRDGSMTQYDLSLTFGEIDPIYEPDYYEGEGLEGMGW